MNPYYLRLCYVKLVKQLLNVLDLIQPKYFSFQIAMNIYFQYSFEFMYIIYLI